MWDLSWSNWMGNACVNGGMVKDIIRLWEELAKRIQVGMVQGMFGQCKCSGLMLPSGSR